MKKFLLHSIKIICFLGVGLLVIIGIILIFSYLYYQDGYRSVISSEKAQLFSGMTQDDLILTDTGSQRRTGNTFMSIPEWYIVSLSDDYTRWLEQGNNPSDFPYIQYLQDFWYLYGRITALMDGMIPRDYEYHTMVRVIGVSTTLEFGLKWVYESSIGRITSWQIYDSREDQYFANISREYVEFIRLRPWYEYDYKRASSGFVLSSFSLRSVERYCFYSIEFFFKKYYAKIIGDATHASFALPDVWTQVSGNFSGIVLDPKTVDISIDSNDLKITRYYPFTQNFPKILAINNSFPESIAGNKRFASEFISSAVNTGSFISLMIPIETIKYRQFYFSDISGFRGLIQDSRNTLQHIYDF